jgi:nicotianamine synthase
MQVSSETVSSETKKKILSLHSQLSGATSLKPSPEVNRLFTELVDLTVGSSASVAKALLADDEIKRIIPDLRSIGSTGEFHLESYWAGKILGSKHPAITLEEFPYYDNYLKLTELEFRSLSLLGARAIKRILFVGSGPLPLSSILMARKYGLYASNLDNDADAVRQSTRLIKHLGLSDITKVELGEAQDYKEYGKFDAVFLASLVGLDPREKQSIISVIQQQLSPGGMLVLRSAHNLRTLLYPEVNVDDIEGLQPLVVIQPLNEVVNSVVILEKPCKLTDGHLVVEDKHQPSVYSHFQQFCREIITDIYHYPHNAAWHFDIDRAEEVYSGPRSNVFVARFNGEILGCAAVRTYDRDYPMFEDRYDEKTAGIWRFFISPHHRDMDIDGILQQHIEKFAREAGYNKLYAHDQRNVPGALRKYIRNGYEVTQEEHGPLGTVHFEKLLKEATK